MRSVRGTDVLRGMIPGGLTVGREEKKNGREIAIRIVAEKETVIGIVMAIGVNETQPPEQVPRGLMSRTIHQDLLIEEKMSQDGKEDATQKKRTHPIGVRNALRVTASAKRKRIETAKGGIDRRVTRKTVIDDGNDAVIRRKETLAAFRREMLKLGIKMAGKMAPQPPHLPHEP